MTKTKRWARNKTYEEMARKRDRASYRKHLRDLMSKIQAPFIPKTEQTLLEEKKNHASSG